MKKFTKILVALLVLATFVGIFAAMPALAAPEYKAIALKTAQLTVGHYTNTALTGDIVQHSANKNYKEEVGCMIDNDNKGAYWSKPYKFSDLKDNGGSIVPTVLIDVANGGDPVTISGCWSMILLRPTFPRTTIRTMLYVWVTRPALLWQKSTCWKRESPALMTAVLPPLSPLPAFSPLPDLPSPSPEITTSPLLSPLLPWPPLSPPLP